MIETPSPRSSAVIPAPRSFIGPVAAIVMAGVAATGCGAFSQQGELIVRVVDARSGAAITNAVVDADYQQHRTDGSGRARFQLAATTYDVSVDHPAYLPLTTTVVLAPGAIAAKTIGLYPRPGGPQPDPASPQPGSSAQPSAAPSAGPEIKTATIFGRVTDDRSTRLPNATVFIESGWGIPLGQARTNAVGEYRVEKLPRGQQARVTVILDGYKSVTREATPAGDWRMDFVGVYALRKDVPPVQDPSGHPFAKVTGRVEDTMGRPIDGAIIKAEADGVRFNFSQMAIARGGRYELKCPTQIPIRFTASKVNHRPVSFVEAIDPAVYGQEARMDFTSGRALDPTPILEGK